jgi:hypothetical protein
VTADPGGDEPSRLDMLRDHVYRSADLHKIPPPDPLVENWLDRDTLGWLIGESGHGKSFAALDLAGCVSNGMDWHGNPTKQAAVLYVILEGIPGLNGRVRAWEDYYQQDMAVEFLVTRRLHIVRDAEVLAELGREISAGLVIIDTQNRAALGLDENSNVDMGRLVASLEDVREGSGGACVATIHHTAIGGFRPRGSGVIDASATTTIRVARDGAVVKIANGKQKDHAQQSSVMLAATSHAGGLVFASEGAELAVAASETKVWAALKNLIATKANVTHTDIKQAVTGPGGMPVSTFGWALRRLVERGMVTRKGNSYSVLDATQGRFGD